MMMFGRIDNAPDWSTQENLRNDSIKYHKNLTSVSSIHHVTEYGGISQMSKKPDYPKHEVFLEKTYLILYNKYLTTSISL